MGGAVPQELGQYANVLQALPNDNLFLEAHMGAELEYYKEHLAHGRHIEVQRSTVAVATLTISGTIIGLIFKTLPLSREILPYTITLAVLGFLGALVTAKLFERFKLHSAIAREARNLLDPNLAKLRSNAEKIHKKDFPWLYRIQLHRLWTGTLMAVSLFGIVMTLFILRMRNVPLATPPQPCETRNAR